MSLDDREVGRPARLLAAAAAEHLPPATPRQRWTGPPTWPARARRAATRAAAQVRAGGDAWYLVAATVVNIGNFVFFGLVGHLLRPSSYGAVAALLNVVSIAAIPLNALQAAVVQETVRQSRGGAIPTARRAGTAFAAASLAATAAIAAASPAMARFFGLATVVPVVLLAVWFAPSISSSLYDGLLIGTLRWRPIAASLVLGVVVRVGFALVAGAVDPSIDGPVLATVANAAVTLAVVVYALRTYRGPGQRAELRLPVRAVVPTILSLTGYSVLVASDTLLARHILSPAVSGDYAAAVTAGRIALFLPLTVTVVAFPRFVADEGRGDRAHRLLVSSLLGMLGLGLAAAGVLAAFSHLVVGVLFGHRYTGAAPLVGILGVEGTLLGAISLLTYFHLARRSYYAAAPAAATAVAAAAALAARPGPEALADLMVATAAACLAVMVAGALPDRRRPA